MGCMEEYSEKKQECPYCGYPQEIKNISPSYQTPGTILSERYMIGRAFHQDSIGISYLGWDNLIEKKIVIKEYFPEKIAFRIDGREIVSEPKWEKLYETGKKAFFQETQNWGQLGNFHGIAKVYDQMMQYGTAYYVREWVPGRTIREIVERENPVIFGQARSWMRQLIQILLELQQAGRAHGNLSIDNIVVTDEEIKLINFGMRVNDSKARGKLFEENPYIPREIYEDTELFWQKADVYAAAAVFYRMVTGEIPYFQEKRIRKEKIKAPAELGVWVHPETEKGLMAILNGDPKRKEINLKKLEQIVWTANQGMREKNRKREESRNYFLPVFVGIEGVIVVILAIILILVW